MTNELLRAHVTRVGFNLQLTKNQIAELIWLDYELSDPRSVNERLKASDNPRVDNHAGRNLLTNNIASRGALMARGLIVYQAPNRKHRRGQTLSGESMRDRYSITAAGRAVIDLLKMAGLWDEVNAEIPWAPKPAPWTSFTAEEEIKHLRARVDEATQALDAEREKTREADRRAADAHHAQMRAELELGRMKERINDMRDMFEAAGVVGGEAA